MGMGQSAMWDERAGVPSIKMPGYGLRLEVS
jgi:hypothetical protein